MAPKRKRSSVPSQEWEAQLHFCEFFQRESLNFYQILILERTMDILHMVWLPLNVSYPVSFAI